MKKSIFKNCKIVANTFFMLCVLNTQAFAQVQTGLMKCSDPIKNINFSVHFKGGEVLLLLKGFTYRVPYIRSFVDTTGVRWSVYLNREIVVRTILPYKKIVDITAMPSDDHIVTGICE
jgi:hypothetical protein